MVGLTDGRLSRVASRVVGVFAVAAFFACATAPTPEAPDAGSVDWAEHAQVLERIAVERDGDETVITLVGLDNPAYSAFRLEQENVVVVDLPGVEPAEATSLMAAVSDSSRQVAVYDGLVDQVSTSSFESADGESTTRVEIALATAAEYEVVPASEGLTLRVRPGAGLAARPQGSPATAVDEDPWAGAGSAEAAEAEPTTVSDSLDMVDAVDAVEPALVVRQADPAKHLRSVGAERMDGGVLLHIEADGIITSAESFTLDGPDRLVIDLPDLQNDFAKKQVAVGSDWVSQVRIGSHPGKVRVVLDGGPSAGGFQGRRMVPAADGLYLTIGDGAELEDALARAVSAADASLVSVPAEAPETSIASVVEETPEKPMQPEPVSVAAPATSGVGMAEIYGIQYDSSAERDRVAVLADRAVDYQILTPDAETVVVSIPNAMIAEAAGERITPKLGGPLSLVTSFQQPDVSVPEVRVVMKRAPGLEPQVLRRGSLIFVDFENTGVAANPPPAFIPGEKVRASGSSPANALRLSDPAPGESEVLGVASMGDAGSEPEAGNPADVPAALGDAGTAHAALPAFDDAATGTGLNDDWSAPASASAAPASLEPPAAIEVLEEGGLIDGKEYKGRRISLDFKDVEIADVLRLVAEVSDLNIIAGDEVTGLVTIRLVEVPWDQALDVILLTKGLGFVRVGNVLRIAPADILKVEEEVRLQERRNKEKLEDLEVKLQPVNYAAVKDVSDLVKRLLSPRGTVNVDERTNTVIIKDISSVIDEATALIQAVDTQTPQVMIEARIVEASLEFSRELGSVWGVGNHAVEPTPDPKELGPITNVGTENFRFKGQNSVAFFNPITSNATGLLTLGAYLLDDNMKVDVQIQAAESTGDGKVISSPRVVTLDNREAVIEQGVSIPFQTFENGDAKLEFIDAVLSLKVTPHITSDKSIIMTLEVTRNAPDASVSTPTGSPAIAKNQAKTETLVKDGQTLVIGGIYTIDKSTRDTRVPYLHRIPLLGAAFKSKEVSDKRKELLIFVTPRIVVNPALAAS